MSPVPYASPAATAPQEPRPWYRHGMVWMVICGPAVVVVAGFFTLWLAIRHPDPVVDTPDRGRAGLAHALGEGRGTMAPAQTARNHTAATLGVAP